MVYIALLSILMVSVVASIFSIQQNNSKLEDSIIKEYSTKKGFGALIAVLILSAGAFAILIVTVHSSYMYADSIEKRELRIQARLNVESCLQQVTIMIRQDRFLVGDFNIKELGCTVELDLLQGGGGSGLSIYNMDAVASVSRVKAYETRVVEIAR